MESALPMMGSTPVASSALLAVCIAIMAGLPAAALLCMWLMERISPPRFRNGLKADRAAARSQGVLGRASLPRTDS
jgi:hypothetical protein